MNHKRKRSHKQVRCTMCTQWSWRGNTKERFRHQSRKQTQTKFQDTKL